MKHHLIKLTAPFFSIVFRSVGRTFGSFAAVCLQPAAALVALSPFPLAYTWPDLMRIHYQHSRRRRSVQHSQSEGNERRNIHEKEVREQHKKTLEHHTDPSRVQ